MKRYRLLNWGMVMASLIFSLVLMGLGPSRIVMHFTGAGVADSWSGRSGLLLEPLLLLFIAGICVSVASHTRRRAGQSTLPSVTFGEWRLLAMVFILMIVFALLQLYQIQWLAM